MDDQLRRAERAAATGSPEDVARFERLCGRIGLFFRDRKPDEILSDAEETQQDYDETWWHGNTARKCGIWRYSDWRHGDVDFNSAVFKAHHQWGHRGWGSKNSKRQTLRTHRDGSRRNYRLRTESHEEVEQVEQAETAHARRRKKRFGGRETRKHEWSYNPETKRYRSWCKITKPNLDD